MPSLALIVPLLVNIFLNKLESKVPNNIPRNPRFCSLASFVIVSLTPFINKPDYSRDLTIFIISFISSLEIINVVPFAKSEGLEVNIRGRVLDPNIFLWIAASVADPASVNPNGIKTLLANGLSSS